MTWGTVISPYEVVDILIYMISKLHNKNCTSSLPGAENKICQCHNYVFYHMSSFNRYLCLCLLFNCFERHEDALTVSDMFLPYVQTWNLITFMYFKIHKSCQNLQICKISMYVAYTSSSENAQMSKIPGNFQSQVQQSNWIANEMKWGYLITNVYTSHLIHLFHIWQSLSRSQYVFSNILKIILFAQKSDSASCKWEHNINWHFEIEYLGSWSRLSLFQLQSCICWFPWIKTILLHNNTTPSNNKKIHNHFHTWYLG